MIVVHESTELNLTQSKISIQFSTRHGVQCVFVSVTVTVAFNYGNSRVLDMSHDRPRTRPKQGGRGRGPRWNYVCLCNLNRIIMYTLKLK